eukprot:312805-Pyramimonas_sp.AAC.1
MERWRHLALVLNNETDTWTGYLDGEELLQEDGANLVARAGAALVRAAPNQSEEGQEDIPGVATNRRREKRIYPRQEPIRGGTRGYTRGGDQSEKGKEDIPL